MTIRGITLGGAVRSVMTTVNIIPIPSSMTVSIALERTTGGALMMVSTTLTPSSMTASTIPTPSMTTVSITLERTMKGASTMENIIPTPSWTMGSIILERATRSARMVNTTTPRSLITERSHSGKYERSGKRLVGLPVVLESLGEIFASSVKYILIWTTCMTFVVRSMLYESYQTYGIRVTIGPRLSSTDSTYVVWYQMRGRRIGRARALGATRIFDIGDDLV
ncbi:hypothetical protein J3R82DRAFT_9968 [Butyriboletus roseoflavus]|nr:hypothetical protein J3R82DRAFT_9968 [Butyriboletus roseoflavus]